jgi:hypothetical protein
VRPLFLKIILVLLTLPSFGQQHYIVDPDFSTELGNRYYRRVIGIEYEPEWDTYMVAGTFAGGSPFIPCINRINGDGTNYFLWNPENPESCTGVLNNFFSVPDGYRFGANMINRTDDGVLIPETVPDLSNTWQITTSSPRGWSDENGMVYVGSHWRLTDVEGEPETGVLLFTPEGDRVDTFPYLRCGHPEFGSTTAVSDIYEYDEDRLMLGGGFDSLAGHLSYRMARIFKDGTLDTTFSSQLEPHFRAHTLDVDEQGRVLVYHVAGGSEETPNDEIEIWRLLPDGSLDPTWNLVDLVMSEEDPSGFSATNCISLATGSYIIYGRFNFVNGEPRSSICLVDSTGILQSSFNDFPFSVDGESQPQLANFGDTPQILVGERTPDGGIMLGGMFTHFHDQPFLNLIKLIPSGFVSTDDKEHRMELRVFPNPASGSIRVAVQPSLEASADRHFGNTVVNIVDLSGRIVASYPWRNKEQYDISSLSKGIYLVELRGDDGILGVEKVVKE